jgi:hypothetical protein
LCVIFLHPYIFLLSALPPPFSLCAISSSLIWFWAVAPHLMPGSAAWTWCLPISQETAAKCRQVCSFRWDLKARLEFERAGHNIFPDYLDFL